MSKATPLYRDPLKQRGRECTIETESGEFCGASALVEVPFPICKRHAQLTYVHVAQMLATQHGAKLPWEPDAVVMDTTPTSYERQRARVAARSVVYYVRDQGHIKIGFTSDLPARLAGLRLDQEHVLATEPGAKSLEGKRHRQFAHLARGRYEHFREAPDLMEHIASLAG